MAALVIRTLYNNRNWMDPCRSPYSDNYCYFCLGNKCHLDIIPPSSPGIEICDGRCWEQVLCKEYFWGCVPKGNYWGKKAKVGMRVFFVFRQHTKPMLYTLWGKATICQIDGFLNASGVQGKHGYNLIHFDKFMPAEKAKMNLTAVNIVGNSWGRGNYRYIGENIENKLDSLI